MSTRDLWSTLSTELCLFIIDYLPPKSLLAASQVSCQWRHLCDSIILPQLKLELPRLLRHTSRPTHNISDWSSQDVDNLLKQLPRISATDFFSDIPTFRTLNLALRLLRDAWDGGRPRNVEILNAGGHRLKQRHAYHSRQITSVIIDAENQVIITGDINGLVICWDVKTGEKVQDFVIHEDPLDPSLRAMIGTMALKGNLLAIGCWINGDIKHPPDPKVQLHRRYPDSERPLTFCWVGHFTVTSSVLTVVLEEFVCIVAGVCGEIEFWRLRDGRVGTRQSQPRAVTVRAAKALTIDPSQTTLFNLPPWQPIRMHYCKPNLHVFDLSISLHHPKGSVRGQDLWDYPPPKVARIPADRTSRQITIGSPVIPVIGSFPAGFSNYLAVLRSLETGSISVLDTYSGKHAEDWSIDTSPFIANRGIRSLDAMPGYFATGTQAVTSPDHQLPNSQAAVHLFHESGDEIAVYEDHHGDVNAIALDPCFLVSVSDDLTIKFRDFRPQLSGYS